MVTSAPPSPPGVTKKRDLIELRVANLRRELEAETDPTAEAAILYEVGGLFERELDRPEEALRHYDRATAVDPSFQPPHMARLRIVERDSASHLISGLCEAQLAGAPRGSLRAAALLDLALVSDDWDALLTEAIDQASEPVVAGLILEWLAEARGDAEALRRALRAQVDHASDPELRASLLIDVALAALEGGQVDAALEALEDAAESPAVRWQARMLAMRVAREHDRWRVFDRTAVAMARELEVTGEGDAREPLELPVSQDRRASVASVIWQEAAARRFAWLDDPQGAAELLANALRARPEDRGLRLDALTLAEAAGDLAGLEAATAWFRDHHPEHPGFVAHQVRRALCDPDFETAAESLRRIVDHHPGSPYPKAALTVTLAKAEAIRARVDNLVERANPRSGEDRARLLWRAAQLAARLPDALLETQTLYSQATAAASESTEAIMREASGAALLLGRFDLFRGWCESLLTRVTDADERATVQFSKYQALQRGLGAGDEACRALAEALEKPENERWAPFVARVRAAWSRDDDLLIRAHHALATREHGDVRVGHLCAAAQAYARQERWDAAEDTIRRALEEAPDDPYAISMLQGVLRESGRPEAATSLAQERSGSHPGESLDELSLLLAGATAEREGKLAAARHAYELALGSAPDSCSAALALLDVARRQGDGRAAIRAYGVLAESRLEGGVPELFAMLLGDALVAAHREGEAAEAYARALEHPATAVPAAIGVLSIPARLTTDAQRAAAERIVAEAEPHTDSATSSAFAEAYDAWRSDLTPGLPPADAWLRLCALSPNESLRASTRLQGLRAIQATGGAEAADEALLVAQVQGALLVDELESAIGIEELLQPADDAELRAAALRRRHDPDTHVGLPAVTAACCRALIDAERGAEAVGILSRELDERPEDLALWEALRGAARQAEDWPLVALACERLAAFVDGSLRADLIEEAAVVCVDQLHQDTRAEDLFRAALEADPHRDVAFRRLHDLLAERRDPEALEALVATRLELAAPTDRVELLYERARLLRGFSERVEALHVLEELLSVAPDHAGALALAAEVHVSLGQWEGAVDHLKRLAHTEIPDTQKRVAHLGAAEFLEARLQQNQEALGELRAVERLGLEDARTMTRIGRLEVVLGENAKGADAFRRALELEPAHRPAIAELVALVGEAERGAAAQRYEEAIWNDIDHGHLDAELLEGLRDAADWRSHDDRVAAIHECLAGLGVVAEGSRPSSSHPSFDHIPLGSLGDGSPDETLEHVVLRAGPSLVQGRPRYRRKAAANSPVHRQLDRLSKRFGSSLGSVWLAEAPSAPLEARVSRNGELAWQLQAKDERGLEEASLFRAGRFAWAAPRGASALIDGSIEEIAARLAAVLRASHCEVALDGDPLGALEVKLPRSVRRIVRDLASHAPTAASELRALARRLQQSADRAGLIACGDIGVALAVVSPQQRATIESVRSSRRALDLLRFWVAADSARWGLHG